MYQVYPSYMPYQQYGMNQQQRMEQQCPQFGQNNIMSPTQMSGTTPQQNVTWIPVSGVQGAKDHIVQPGMTAWLMDNNESKFYVKSADNLGVTTLKAFQFVEIGLEQPQIPQVQMDPAQYVSRQEFDELKAKLEELTTAQTKRPAKANKEGTENG